MSYPKLPNNRLLVKVNDEFVDLTQKFKMVLTDDYTLSPPEPKTYTVDIPGGNGTLDLTEALVGDTVYNNRQQEFTFLVIDTDEFERVKTQVSNFLHGKAFDYKLTMDEDYTYHGRFKVTEYSHKPYTVGNVGTFKIIIDANPYKIKDNRPIDVNAVGGKTVTLTCGRMRVRPTITTDGYVKVICNGKMLTLPQGTWLINDLLLHEGDNELYINSFDVRNLTWGNLKTNSVTWGQFAKLRLYEWYKSNGDGTYVIQTWNTMLNSKWSDLTGKKWTDLMYMSDITQYIKDVTVSYEWGDL